MEVFFFNSLGNVLVEIQKKKYQEEFLKALLEEFHFSLEYVGISDKSWIEPLEQTLMEFLQKSLKESLKQFRQKSLE